MKTFHFEFPWLLTATHALASTVGCMILIYWLRIITPVKLSSCRDHLVLIGFSLLYTVNIAISNVSLNLVSLPFHQIVRSTNPAFTVVLEWIVMSKRHSVMTCLTVVPVVAGVALATYGEYEMKTFLEVLYTILGVFLSALKGVATNMLLIGHLQLHPADLLWRMSGLAFVQCVIIAYMNGELTRYVAYAHKLAEQKSSMALASSEGGGGFAFAAITLHGMYLAVFSNAAMAFALNIASFVANKKTGALSMTVAGNVKQVLSIILSVWIFDYVITAYNALGEHLWFFVDGKESDIVA
jgi:hypothetical protein